MPSTRGGPMDFGIFLEQTRRGTSQAEAFREMFEQVDAAEAWGLDIVWLAEMMVNPARSVLSAPLLVASWIAARTRRLRVGTAVQLLPLNHPVRVAGEVTTLDHLSQGRFDFGIGRSGSPRAYDALGVPYEQPHPPVRVAATTPETFPRIARMGLPIFVGLRGMDIPELAACLQTYRE